MTYPVSRDQPNAPQRMSGEGSTLTAASGFGSHGGRPKITISLVLVCIVAVALLVVTIAFSSPFGWTHLSAGERIALVIMKLTGAAIVGAYALYWMRHRRE